MILPVQYPMNMIALTVVFLVYPATLEAMILSVMGIPAEYAPKNHIPASRATFFLGSTCDTIRQPARVSNWRPAIVKQRDFRTLEVMIVARTTQIKVKTDEGI